ncbi:NAD(P)H-dependent flavin oxidoreductase YrpB (nitropropane dioxygenase family) [Prauserella isguenensis]|uniref:Propionate 3-nitronate monooxygenase n=1 Tax=Prauserella isguenensis TaxID=1470180 RepID=A0A839S7Q2_9PSEU|nr:NAD(P)H-dependent flavin oxidoreductase YrpB (nitropropane dioxygenase family) [Prauserella isguenensis]
MLTDLGISLPVLAAPMAGGPTAPDLVTAAGRAGSMGFLAGGYKTPSALAEQIAAVRADGVPFGVNLFAPNPVPASEEDYHAYRDALLPEADRHGVHLPDTPIEDDDHWAAKIDLLLADPVPVVSLTFGLPHGDVVAALRAAGSMVVQTVTSAPEARLAEEAGVDALIVQSSAAGGHSGTFTPARTPPGVPLPRLLRDVRADTRLPLVGAGGVSRPADVTAALDAGAEAVAVGTALLRTHESGTSAPHKAALVDSDFDSTVVTRAFTGRPARALRNHFTDRFESSAPCAYPAVHHLTSPLRKAATAAGDSRLIHLWAGTGHRDARAEPAADTLMRLAGKA